jgi:uncharacterized caspase-like protein
VEAGILRRVVSRNIWQKTVARSKKLLQGPGTAEYDGVASPGTATHWTQHAEEACGRTERCLSLRLDRCAGGFTGCHALEGFAWPTMEDMRAARRLPAWVTAVKGPTVPGRSRGQNQQMLGWLILMIVPSSGRHIV